MDILKTHRARIDRIDEEIIKLLRARYDVIEEVAALKTAEGIPAVLPERVNEVITHAGKMAAQKNLDEKFIRRLYEQIVEHSCAMEEAIMCAAPKQKK